MKALFDTNVVLDVLLDRAPFAADAARLMARVERAEIGGVLCATTVTTLHYLVAKVLGARAAVTHIGSLLALFEVAAVNRVVLEGALASELADFEDAVIVEAARHAGADCVVTRNLADFARSPLPVHAPADLLGALDTSSG